MARGRFGASYVRRTIRRNGIRKGLLGGSRFWMAVFVAGRLAGWTGKVTKRGELPVVFSEKMKLGESYEIRHIGPD
jgi:hypothetical protein